MASGSAHDGAIDDIATLHLDSVCNYGNTDQTRRSERQHDPNNHSDSSEILRQRATKRQRSFAAIWSKSIRGIEVDIVYIEKNLDAITDTPVIRELLSRVEALWSSFESTHAKYIPGIKKPKRHKEAEQRFIVLQKRFFDIMRRCRQRLRLESSQEIDDDNTSICSRISTSSRGSKLSRASSNSSQKEKLRTVLLANKKLEFARARAKEEEEEARRKAQQDSRRELRRLEEAAALAELEWKFETEYDEEIDLVDSVKDCKPFVEEDNQNKPGLQNSTTYKPITRGLYKSPEVSFPVKETSNRRVLPEYQQDWSTPFHNFETVEEAYGTGVKTRNSKHREPLPRMPKTENYRSSTHSSREEDGNNDNIPSDPVTAMWKIQLLNGITPTKFSGNPSEFPFFQAQVQAHLESRLLSDAQKVEYLPKFLTGEALEVVKRNRGCSFKVLMETLEDRYGQAIQISQACIEDLVSGPKITFGDSAGLLNFAERLNTATKVLTGRNEQEISVATNLKRIVNRLPNDIIGRWQIENYKITSRGEVARLKDIARFVKRQAAIKNDPVFGSTKQESICKDGKYTVDKSCKKMDLTEKPKPSTIAATSVDDSSGRPSVTLNNCEICKGPLHKLHQCPIIKGCDRLAVRRQFAASYGFCFNCGKRNPGHSSNICPEPPACPRCPGRHLEILHKDYTGRFNNRKPRAKNQDKEAGTDQPKGTVPKDPARIPLQQMGNNTDEVSDKKPEAVVSAAGVSRAKTQVLLNVVPVTVTSENGNATSTYAFLDNGCTDTLIDQELADLLQIKGTPEDIQINTITTSDQPRRAQRVKFTLSSVERSGDVLEVEDAYILPDLNQSERVLPGEVDVSRYPHLQDLEFPDVDLKRVSILVGSNLPMAHVQMEVRAPEDKKNGPFAYRFPLGWSLSGPLDTNGSKTKSVNSISLDRNLNDQVERFWAVEDYGAVKKNEKSLSMEDKRALQIIQETTQIEDGHYQVGLLWREDDPCLPSNRPMAEARLESTRRRLARPGNEELAQKYRAVMSDYIKKGYARRLTPEESAKDSPKCWYLPHHPVTNPHKPDKVRIVFDAAAEFKGTSLNKHLLQGPDMTNSLTGVLLRFRQGSIGMAADIEAMFHQVKVRKQDQDALRFLWWTNSYTDSPDVYAMQVHIFGATSSPCVANSALRRTAIDNATDFDKEVVEAVNTNFYVDDGLPSCNDPDSAVRLANGMMDILSRGGFYLTKFTSNSKQVLSALPVERRSSPDLNLDLDELPIERALGVRWFVETDEIGFEIRDLKRPDTKRGILSIVCSVYDPLGMAAPVTLSARAIIQHLWKAKVNWDDPLDPQTLERWNRWKNQLASLSTLRVPRCYFLPETDVSRCHLQLHHFSDASEVGYGSCSYLRIEDPDDTVRCAFIMGKSRNAPVKFTSIPRLELQAAVLATRMNKMLQEELTLPIKKTVYWTDSEIVLHYLRNKHRRFQTYVANRVEEIKENSQVEEWRHIPGVMNPADDASRGLNPSELSPEHRWLQGPEFLWHPEASWPSVDTATVSEDKLELRKESNLYSSTVVTQTETSKVNESITKGKVHQIIDHCSDWSQLRRRIAWLIRFTQFIRDRKGLKNGRLFPEDYEAATNAIARLVQNEAYESEIADLRAGRPVKTTSKIANLNPILDDHGVLRINGRIKNASVAYDASHQIILPKNHHVTSVLVQHTHESIGHLGREHVIAQLRQKFWIPQVRVLVRSVLGRCIKCKKIHAKPMTQQMAPLPKDRLTAYQPPFTSTGVDMFGPLYVKHGRGTAKRWGCLFTCLTTRSIHLELANSLGTDDFIMCLRRFINRRGEISELRCDNGSNFVGAERELKNCMNSWNEDQITKELAEQGCKWVFQPPTASSMSGVWERLVRSVKRVLKSVIGSYLVTDVVLQTLFTEVERILNGRALTANSDDPSDLEPLTPAHFLMQRKVVSLPPGVFTKNDMYSRKKWRQVQYLTELFWGRWLKEYLPTLQVRGKWQRRRTNLQSNDLVLLVDDKVPRGRWRLGRVLETYAGPDGLIRTVKVKTKDSTYIRPIQKLCFLENDKRERVENK